MTINSGKVFFILLGFILSHYSSHNVLVSAHCVHGDGHIDHLVVGCTPTVSPFPTESPAPSPSPSSVPTDTQAPSHSIAPSSSPTNAPTTNEPSAEPTDSPTESPAPSPSPSGIPSASPTRSSVPSLFPTASPSEAPTSSPSQNPTGPILFTVVGVELVVQNVTGEREMNVPDVRYFEKKTALYLQKEVELVPGVFKIEVEDVIVTDQTLVTIDNNDSFINKDPFLRRRRQMEQTEAQTDLYITINVVVSVVFNRSETAADLKMFFEEFFENPKNRDELRDTLEREDSFAQGIFIKEEISSSEASVNKKANGSAVTAAVLAIVALIVGSGLLWMWIQSRRIVGRRCDDSRKLQNVGTISRSFESDDNSTGIGNKPHGIKITTSSESYYVTESRDDQRSSASSSQLMYIPTIMPTESNIEVPVTPGTALAINGFATPASAHNFATPANASGFATPASANGLATPGSVQSMSNRKDSSQIGSISKLLVPCVNVRSPPNAKLSSVEILNDIGSSKSRKQKIPLPPNILGSLKSPFRPKVRRGDEDEYVHDSYSGAGVVSGKNNVRAVDDRKKGTGRFENGLSPTFGACTDFPLMEIGGPGSASHRPSSPYERPKSKGHYSRSTGPSPPMVIGGPPEKAPAVAKSTIATGHGVVDIVDEIAYLYSSNNNYYEKRRGDSSI